MVVLVVVTDVTIIVPELTALRVMTYEDVQPGCGMQDYTIQNIIPGTSYEEL